MTAEAALAKQRMGAAAMPFPPPPRLPRARVQAWTLALAAHGALIALALWGVKAPSAEAAPPLVRLVFVEPPPPPPLPVGAPTGTGSVAALPAAPPASAVASVDEPRAKKTSPKQGATMRRPATTARRKPAPGTQRPPAPALAPEAVRPGSFAGTASGTAQGASGGTEGGTPGGVVGGRGSGPLPAGQVAHPPVPLARVAPEYPRAARQRGIRGLVLLEATLDTEGRIKEDIKVLRSVPDLDEAAVTALRQWRFAPARDEQGRTVSVILEVPFRFILR